MREKCWSSMRSGILILNLLKFDEQFLWFLIHPSFNILMWSNSSLCRVIYKLTQTTFTNFKGSLLNWLVKVPLSNIFGFLWPLLGCGKIAWDDIFFCGKLKIKAQPEYFLALPGVLTLKAISPQRNLFSSWFLASKQNYKLFGVQMYHVTSPRAEFRPGCS